MRTKLRRGMASLLSVALLSVVSVGSATAASAPELNRQTDRIYVMNNNIENRSGCNGNYNNLLNQAKSAGYYPDLFIVQQVRDQAGMNELIKDLRSSWGVEYQGAIAVGSPTSENGMYPEDSGPCLVKKRFQTNAVLWRKDRFSQLGKSKTWHSDASINGGKCANLATVDPKQARTINVGVALKDKVANRTVVAASIHWPTNDKDRKRDAHACARENFSEANTAVDNLADLYGSGPEAMRVIGGDMNAATSVDTDLKDDRTWWDKAIDRAGYIDPIANLCGQKSGSDVGRDACKPHGTLETDKGIYQKRIDFILIEHGKTTKAGASTISEAAAGGKYSTHLAVRATAKYLP
jgi:hypothetical protein